MAEFIRLGRHIINLDAIACVNLVGKGTMNERPCVTVYLMVPSGNEGRYGSKYQEFFDEDAQALRVFFDAVAGESGYRANQMTLRK